MTSHICRSKTGAKRYAARMRRKGFNATIFNVKGKGYGVSITRK